jgi:hypothetical protein
MGQFDINQAEQSNMTNTVSAVTVDTKTLDGVSDQPETYWDNTEWSQWWGYFTDIPDLHSALLMKSIWNVGKGWTSDSTTTTILENITGWGKDTFDDILFNMDLISNVGGDSFAEIMRDGEDGRLINLKPLDPSTMRIVVNRQGIIKRYEQTSKNKTPNKKFQPENILHFSKNRLGDQIHGISKIEALKKTIDAENESFEDMKKLSHHQARPFIMWKLKTDDPTKIKNFVAKIDAARNLGEDMFIPDDEETVTWERIDVSLPTAILAWRDDIRNKFYRGVGLPLIIFSSGGSTESGGKVEYLAHEQVFAREQKYIEMQIWNQLGLKIKLNTPTTLLDNLQRDEKKDAGQGLEVQPQDVSVPAV